MLGNKDYFQGGKVDKDALLSFIRDIKKNTKLTDEDAAIIAASKVRTSSFNFCAKMMRNFALGRNFARSPL